jgi:hypothetical protein
MTPRSALSGRTSRPISELFSVARPSSIAERPMHDSDALQSQRWLRLLPVMMIFTPAPMLTGAMRSAQRMFMPLAQPQFILEQASVPQ